VATSTIPTRRPLQVSFAGCAAAAAYPPSHQRRPPIATSRSCSSHTMWRRPHHPACQLSMANRSPLSPPQPFPRPGWVHQHRHWARPLLKGARGQALALVAASRRSTGDTPRSPSPRAGSQRLVAAAAWGGRSRRWSCRTPRAVLLSIQRLRRALGRPLCHTGERAGAAKESAQEALGMSGTVAHAYPSSLGSLRRPQHL
jgi:hypothetical protein